MPAANQKQLEIAPSVGKVLFMSVEQLIAELKALPWAERRQVAHAILADEASRLPEGPEVIKKTAHETAEKTAFSARWSGRFTLPEPDPEDPRLTYLLHRFSA
jgi:hypothetical protein